MYNNLYKYKFVSCSFNIYQNLGRVKTLFACLLLILKYCKHYILYIYIFAILYLQHTHAHIHIHMCNEQRNKIYNN